MCLISIIWHNIELGSNNFKITKFYLSGSVFPDLYKLHNLAWLILSGE